MKDDIKIKKVALYARVSTIDQNPENQLLALREYVKNHRDEYGNRDMEIYHEYVDYISGSKQSRTELNKLMINARNHRFSDVIIWKVDRLGRSTLHMYQIVEEWKKLGINFIITTLNIDTNTPSGKLIFGILGQIAEFERELTRQRTKLAYQRAKKEKRPWGRPQGSQDKKPRKKSGYYMRWLEHRDEKVTPTNLGAKGK